MPEIQHITADRHRLLPREYVVRVNLGAKFPMDKFPELNPYIPAVRLLLLPSENDCWMAEDSEPPRRVSWVVQYPYGARLQREGTFV